MTNMRLSVTGNIGWINHDVFLTNVNINIKIINPLLLTIVTIFLI